MNMVMNMLENIEREGVLNGKTPQEGGGQKGFTLLEVMASLAILSMGVLMVIQLFSGGLGLAMAARDQTGAVLLAREKMDEVLARSELKPGTTRGEEEKGLSWEVRVTPFETTLYGYNLSLDIKKVVVSVRGFGRGHEGAYTLTSLKSTWVDEE